LSAFGSGDTHPGTNVLSNRSFAFGARRLRGVDDVLAVHHPEEPVAATARVGLAERYGDAGLNHRIVYKITDCLHGGQAACYSFF
jgi:hypothetical protein